MLLVAAVVSAAAVGCGGSSGTGGDDSQFTTGAELEQAIAEQLSDKQGNPVTPTCPNERLVKGDSITCRADFVDGSFHDFSVKVTGFQSNGEPEIEIDVP